ncbi:hypothetical protein [Natrialba magadii]|nr:hypothetical protein [Natrialba magadii]
MTLNSTDSRAAVSSRVTTDATTGVAGGFAVTGESERSVASGDAVTVGERGKQRLHRRRTQSPAGRQVGSPWLPAWSPQAHVTEVSG